MMPNEDIAGSCRCGQVRFRVKSRPMMTMACHCTGCQKMTASAYSLSALYARAAFELLQGTPVIGGLHGDSRHSFCPHCKSWLYTEWKGMEDLVNVRAMMMDDAATFSPFIESYTSEKLPWAQTGARHSFERFPSNEQFPALLAEYAEHAISNA